MTRQTLTAHREILSTAGRRGFTTERFASPIKAAAAIATRGHAFMSRREYAALLMGRGTATAYRVELRMEWRSTLKRRQRVRGDRRITGVLPGTTRPVAYGNRYDAPVRRVRAALAP